MPTPVIDTSTRASQGLEKGEMGMGIMTAKMRITVGLTCLTTSVLLVAVFIGMIPDRHGAVLDGRRKLCEAIAVNSSILVGTKGIARLEAVLKAVVERDQDLLSAGIRRPNGDLEIEIGPHQANWKDITTDRSLEDQLQVPLRTGQTKWGMVELRFRPQETAGWIGVLTSPVVLLVTFTACGSFIAFMIYLGKMLQHLDPSQAVPRRVRSALDTLAEGLLVIDKDERIVLANQALGIWVGRDPSRLLGRKISDLPWISAQGASPADTPWSRSVRDGCQLAGVEMGLKIGQEGEVRSLIVNATPVLGQNGDYRGVLISLDDVTQLETTRKELQVSKVAAEDANRAKSDFLARMSHEIRTPMNAILGYTDVLRQGYDETISDRQEYLDTIHVSGEHLLALINDILDLSKIEAGHLKLELQPVAPYPLLAQVVSVFRARAAEKDIQLDLVCDGPIPATILTDPVRLRQAIMNLVGNAIKFTEQGGVRLVARMTSCHGQPQLAIDVIDSGIGISAAAIENIFNPFSQADTSITRRFGGTGLGLAISLQLAEALGGGINVTSTPGQGSTFTVTVDTGSLAGIALLSADDAKLHGEQRGAQTRAVRALPPGRVLVADDGEANRKLLQLVLGRAGMTVVAVENGKQAVEAARSSQFDVVLMDMQMPVMDGYAATTTLRDDGFTLPIIALTAHVMQSEEAKCRSAGCSGFVAKPINMDELFEVIAAQMGAAAGIAEPSAEAQNHRPQPVPPASPTPVNVPADNVDEGPSSAAARPPIAITKSQPTDKQAIEIEHVVNEVLQAMQTSLNKADFPRLATLANSLHEAATVFGLREYIRGTTQLELAARRRHAEDCGTILNKLVACHLQGDIAAEPESPPAPLPRPTPPTEAIATEAIATEAIATETIATEVIASGHPVRSTLPTEDPEFCEIVVEFIEKLHVQLAAMHSAWEDGQWAELGRHAHWLKGSGGTAGFHEFTVPCRELENAAKACDSRGACQALATLEEITSRIETPELSLPAL